MALTRKFLSAMGIESDKVDEIISAHSESLEHFKSENSDLKNKAEKYDEIMKKYSEAETKIKELNDRLQAAEGENADYKGKYESLKAEKEKLESDVATKETAAKKDKALSEALKSKNYSDEAARLIVTKGGYRDKIELDKNGNIKNSDNLFSEIQTDFSVFTPKENSVENEPVKPPTNTTGNAMSKADIMKIKDPAERQKAILEHRDLFGF